MQGRSGRDVPLATERLPRSRSSDDDRGRESGYHRQGIVENVFFRYKSIIGDRLHARHPKAQETEAMLGCNILNRMFEQGRPASVSIGF